MSKKQDILGAAKEILFSDGIHALTMSKVAERAGIGKSTLYEYFKNKEEMVMKALIYIADQYMDLLGEISGNKEISFETHFKIAIQKIIEIIDTDGTRCESLMNEMRNLNYEDPEQAKCIEELVPLLQRVLNESYALLNKGKMEGKIREKINELDIFVMQKVLVLLCIGSSCHAKVMQKFDKRPIEEKVEYIYEYILKTLN